VKISKKVFKVVSEKVAVSVAAGAETSKVVSDPVPDVGEGSGVCRIALTPKLVRVLPCGSDLSDLGQGPLVADHNGKPPGCWECGHYFSCRETVKGVSQ
jgi:hypothetical protein